MGVRVRNILCMHLGLAASDYLPPRSTSLVKEPFGVQLHVVALKMKVENKNLTFASFLRYLLLCYSTRKKV